MPRLAMMVTQNQPWCLQELTGWPKTIICTRNCVTMKTPDSASGSTTRRPPGVARASLRASSARKTRASGTSDQSSTRVAPLASNQWT